MAYQFGETGTALSLAPDRNMLHEMAQAYGAAPPPVI